MQGGVNCFFFIQYCLDIFYRNLDFGVEFVKGGYFKEEVVIILEVDFILKIKVMEMIQVKKIIFRRIV